MQLDDLMHENQHFAKTELVRDLITTFPFTSWLL